MVPRCGRTLLFAAGRNAAPSTGVGLTGYGAIARAHAASIAATPGLSLAGVCDISDERRKLAGREKQRPLHQLLETFGFVGRKVVAESHVNEAPIADAALVRDHLLAVAPARPQQD